MANSDSIDNNNQGSMYNKDKTVTTNQRRF
ncbi:uncharacterized protein G2W53_039178 [Senna tora]|uniref:Uncharacterized protein n=1 Tax=Senna tora TaxID=362788 RepID=A0A834SSY2_9FABA|nr:uncharacterized protein G2W53_039178 [Senna tora]